MIAPPQLRLPLKAVILGSIPAVIEDAQGTRVAVMATRGPIHDGIARFIVQAVNDHFKTPPSGERR